MYNVAKRSKRIALLFTVTLVAMIFLFPVIATIINSFITSSEINKNFGDALEKTVSLIPEKITISQYYLILIEKYAYLNMFWNSVKLSTTITFFHVILSVITAYVFAKVEFKGRDKLFFLYIVVMMMPFQVTLLPNYIQAKFLHIFDTHIAIIAPSIFAPFGVFLLRQYIKCISDEFIEAVALESNSIKDIFIISIIPIIKPGIIALIVLTFAESWNMVEQPLVLLEDTLKHPLSIALNSIIDQEKDVAFAGSVLYMIPIIILFFYFEEYIVEGIGNTKF